MFSLLLDSCKHILHGVSPCYQRVDPESRRFLVDSELGAMGECVEPMVSFLRSKQADKALIDYTRTHDFWQIQAKFYDADGHRLEVDASAKELSELLSAWLDRHETALYCGGILAVDLSRSQYRHDGYVNH